MDGGANGNILRTDLYSTNNPINHILESVFPADDKLMWEREWQSWEDYPVVGID